MHIRGLFDNGAMINAICSSIYRKFSYILGHIRPSTKVLRMADGSRVKSHGQWVGSVGLGGRTVRAAFEIFPSGKGWSLLFGKPLLQEFQAVQDYKRDTLHIPHNGSWITLSNEAGEIESSAEHSGGAETPPSRQVQPNPPAQELVDQQNAFILYVPPQNRAHRNIARHRASIASGIGLSWRHELHEDADSNDEGREGTDMQLNGGNDAPPTRQVQSHNRFSVLASLGDTVLEDDFAYRDYKTAYWDPERLGYRVPRILSVNSEDLLGRRNRGRRNHRNQQ